MAVIGNFLDLDGLKRQCEAGARMGYTGKQIIHPGQIDVVHTAFSPSTERIEWAAGMITAFDEHQKIGKVLYIGQYCRTSKSYT